MNGVSSSIKNIMRNRMDAIIDTIAYVEKMMTIIPMGNITDDFFDTSYAHECFTRRFSLDEQAYLKINYAEHHDLYLLEKQSIADLSHLRNLYEDLEQHEYVEKAMNESSLIFENNTRRPVIGGEDLFSDEAFGEELNWIC